MQQTHKCLTCGFEVTSRFALKRHRQLMHPLNGAAQTVQSDRKPRHTFVRD